MSPIYDSRNLGPIPGPVNKILSLSGQQVVMDASTDPPTTTVLNPDDTYDAEGKAGLTVGDTGGGGDVYVEYALSPNAPANRDVLQVVVGADNQPVRAGFDDETDQRGVKDVLGVPGGTGISDLTGKTLDTEDSVLVNLNPDDAPTPVAVPATAPSPEEAPEAHPAITGGEVKGDNDPEDDKQTGSYESRPKAALYELAKERDLDVDSHSTKADLVAALRGE